jgi:hypothetical protein
MAGAGRALKQGDAPVNEMRQKEVVEALPEPGEPSWRDIKVLLRALCVTLCKNELKKRSRFVWVAASKGARQHQDIWDIP